MPSHLNDNTVKIQHIIWVQTADTLAVKIWFNKTKTNQFQKGWEKCGPTKSRKANCMETKRCMHLNG